MHNHRRGSAVITGGGESRARVVYAIIGAMALLLGVARFAPSDMTPTAYGASDIGDPSASATGKVDPKDVGELTQPSNQGLPDNWYVTYKNSLGEDSDAPSPRNVRVGDIPAICVDYRGAPPNFLKKSGYYTVADTNRITGGSREPKTVDTDLAKKFAAKWGDDLANGNWQNVISQTGVSDASELEAEVGSLMAGWALEGQDPDNARIRSHLRGTHISNEKPAESERARKVAKAMISQAQNYSAPATEADPASVKISQGDRTENGDGTVIPISVSGSSDDNKATLNVEGLPTGAKLTDANGNTVNNGDEISVPSELKLTIPSGTDPGQAKISATTTKTSKLPAGTLLKPSNEAVQWLVTTKPGKDVPSNATAGINVKWDKETPSSSSSSSPSPSSSSPATSSTPKPVVPSSTSSESTTSSSRVTSTSSSSESSSSTSSSTPVVPKNDNPKISTTVDVDGKKSAEGNPVKVDASKLHEGINVKDHIDYEGLAPDTKYEFTGTLMKVENGKASPVSGVKPASTIETIGKDGKGTATVDFGKITDLKPDTQYVVFEKAVPVDKSENPTVDNNGTPKNPSEDKRETVTHEDADDDSQTFVSGGESSSSTTPAPSSTSSSVKPSSSEVTSTSKPAPPAGIHQSPSSTSSTSPSESSTTSTSSSTPKPSKGKISTTVDVDGQRATDEEPVMVEAAKAKEGINVKDHIDYEGLKPGTYRFTGTLMKIEDGQAKPVSGVEPASVYETVGDSGKGTATVDFGKLTRLKADTQYVVFEKAIPVNGLHIPTVNNDGTPKNPSKDDRETVKHEDSNDAAQTFVTTPEGETVPPASSTAPPSSDTPAPGTSKPGTSGSESPTPDTDKPGKPESSKPNTPENDKTPGKPVPGNPSETPDKPGAPKETTPEKPSDSTDKHESETPGKPGTTSSETPAPSNENGNSGNSNGSDNGTNGSDNGGSDNGSNGSNGSNSGSGNGGSDNGSGSGNGSGSESGSSSSHGVGGALASTGANVIWLALLAMILIGAGAGVVLWNRRRSHEG